MAFAFPISEPAGQALAANWTPGADRFQVGVVDLLALRQRDHGAAGVRFAVLRLQHRVNRRVPATVDAAGQLEAQLGLVGQARRSWRPGSRCCRLDERTFAAAQSWRPAQLGIAIGRVEREAGPVEVDPDACAAAAEYRRRSAAADRDGDRHLGGDRVDVERCPHDHVAEVVGSGHGRRDEDDAQRRAPCRDRRGRRCRARRPGGCRRRRRRRAVPIWLAAGQVGAASSAHTGVRRRSSRRRSPPPGSRGCP